MEDTFKVIGRFKSGDKQYEVGDTVSGLGPDDIKDLMKYNCLEPIDQPQLPDNSTGQQGVVVGDVDQPVQPAVPSPTQGPAAQMNPPAAPVAQEQPIAPQPPDNPSAADIANDPDLQ
jgi:hypothetical protein